METFLTATGGWLFNTNTHIYHNIGHNTYSNLDLAIGLAVLLPLLEWDVGTNSYGSDNFHKSLTYIGKGLNSWRSHCKFIEARANWNTLTETSELHYTYKAHLPVEKAAQLVTAHILAGAEKSIPQASFAPRNPRRAWWNDDSRRAREAQKKALGIRCRYLTIFNLFSFKSAKALGKRVLCEAKRESWRALLPIHKFISQYSKVLTQIRKLKGSTHT